MSQAKSKGGRPLNSDVGQLDAKIIAVATKLFLKDGFGATSIEAVAKAAGVSKRTLYHRYKDKSELFSAVMHQLIANMSPAGVDELFQNGDLKTILTKLADIILRAAVSKEALALHRLLISEAGRFPALVKILSSEGRRQEAISRISALLNLEVEKGNIKVTNPEFAAEQFLQMLISTPQNRGLGLDVAFDDAQLKKWGEDTVEFFLKACQ